MSWYPEYVEAKMERKQKNIELKKEALKRFREWLKEFRAAHDMPTVYKLKSGIKKLAHEIGEDCGFEKCETCRPHKY